MGFRCLYCHKKCANANWDEIFRCDHCGSEYRTIFDWKTGNGLLSYAADPEGNSILGSEDFEQKP